MATDTKESIEKINEVSRQLLSCIQSVRTNLQPSNTNSPLNSPEDSSKDNPDELTSNKELSVLAGIRHRLISYFFECNTLEELSSETALLQEMLALDNELRINSTLSKQELAEQVLKLKKSKKVAKSYQKY